MSVLRRVALPTRGRRLRFLLACVLALGFPGQASASGDTLRVALFGFVPARDHALALLTERFEKSHPGIVLVARYWDPYVDKPEDNGVEQLRQFDLAEIDHCRFDEIVADPGRFGGLDSLPETLRARPADVAGPARAVANSPLRFFAAPHWVCGNFLLSWVADASLGPTVSFAGVLRSLSPDRGEPLLGDLFGSTTLGEHYADAFLDWHGDEAAIHHLHALASPARGAPDSTALTQVLALSRKVPRYFRAQLALFHDRPEEYAWTFASAPRGAFIGYSEHVFYIEEARKVRFGSRYRPLSKADISVQRFQFKDNALSSPGWVDAFIIPRGRLAAKRDQIEAFIRFAQSIPGYEAYLFPLRDEVPCYLLPAMREPYAQLGRRMPLLSAFQAGIEQTFPILEASLWRGMREAGAVLKTRIAAETVESR